MEKFTSPRHTIEQALQPLITKERQGLYSKFLTNSNISEMKQAALANNDVDQYHNMILSEYVRRQRETAPNDYDDFFNDFDMKQAAARSQNMAPEWTTK